MHLNRFDEAREAILRWHYSHRCPTDGLSKLVVTVHKDGGLFGDCGDVVAALWFGLPPTRWAEPVVELQRVVKAPGETFPLSSVISYGCDELRRRKTPLVVSFADPGEGHHGGLYQSASWNYGGKREPKIDGFMLDGDFMPRRTANSLWGTSNQDLLKKKFGGLSVEQHRDEGKYIYWRALNRTGKKTAKRLGLVSLPYPKPGGKP